MDLVLAVLERLGRDLVDTERDAVGHPPLVLRRGVRVRGTDPTHADDLQARSGGLACLPYCSTLAEMIQTGWLGGPSVIARSAMFWIVFSERGSVARPRMP